MTQSVMHGMPNTRQIIRTSNTNRVLFAYKQSIILFINSNLFWIEKLIKFVSTRIRYGGVNAALYLKNMDDATCWLPKHAIRYHSDRVKERTRVEQVLSLLFPSFLVVFWRLLWADRLCLGWSCVLQPRNGASSLPCPFQTEKLKTFTLDVSSR